MSYNPYAPVTNVPAAPYMGYRSLPPSPLVHPGGLLTPPETTPKLPSARRAHLDLYSLNPSLMDVMVIFLPQSSQITIEPATNPPVSRLRIKLPGLPWRIEVPASNRTVVTVSDVWHALHVQLHIPLTANEELQFMTKETQRNYCQRLQHSPGYFPYPCRVDVLCGRVHTHFGAISETRNGLEVSVEFY